jgi:hypothetical protein
MTCYQPFRTAKGFDFFYAKFVSLAKTFLFEKKMSPAAKNHRRRSAFKPRKISFRGKEPVFIFFQMV